jgi:phosphoserine phosphatase
MPFSSLLLDVDSTLTGIEGIDWLAERRGEEVAARVRALTARAMDGELSLDAVYGERLALVRPGRAELAALGEAYAAAAAPGAREALDAVRAAGVRVVLVSGGIRQAILPFARALGVPIGDVHAVDVVLDAGGQYFAHDVGTPLVTQRGKREVAAALLAGGPGVPALPRPLLAVGDGSTDVAMREVADAFAAYVGFARRDAVVAAADHVVSSYPELAQLVLT